MIFRSVTIAAIVLLAGCGSDDEPTATDRACSVWNDLLTTDPPPSDETVASTLRDVDTDGVDPDVAGAITAVAARLEDGSDISGAYDRLSGLCA